MGITRVPFTWKDPESETIFHFWGLPDIRTVLEEVIETEDQAEDFMAAYERVTPYAEQNIGHIISTINDQDIREDALDLFMVDASDEIHQTFGPDDSKFGSSLALKVIDGEVWTPEGVIEYEQPKTKVKAAKPKKKKRKVRM